MKVLITGGSGQIGSHVAALLLARGDRVLAIDNFATGRRDNLDPHPNLEVEENSIVDAALMDRLFADFRPEVVVHTAASYKIQTIGSRMLLSIASAPPSSQRPARPQSAAPDLFPDGAVLWDQAAADADPARSSD